MFNMKSLFNQLLLVSLFVMWMSCQGSVRKEEKMAADTVTNPEVKAFQKGNVKMFWVKDNAGEHLMPVGLFKDAPQYLIDSLGVGNGVPSSMSAFLMERDDVKVLFDTGKGKSDSRLLPNLKSLGLNPEDIRYIYLTHFHGDHIGGMMRGYTVVFPHAEVYVSRMEYDAWMAMPDPDKAQVVKTMTAYKDRLHLFEFNDTLPGQVVALNAVGHTPGHTVYAVGEFLIIGDLFHGAALQMADPGLCAIFDMDLASAISSRRYFMDYARANHLVMAGMHLPAPAFWSWDK